MALTVWRFATLMLTALAMGGALCHLLELPAKMDFDARLYVMLHRTLYPIFGWTVGVAEGLALITTIVLAIWLRRRREPFGWSAVAAVGMVLAQVVFLAFVHPANFAMAAWPLDAVPADWTRWRDQWEYGHAARAVLMIGALGALTISLLRNRTATADRADLVQERRPPPM
jgi:hypothetical protein